MKKQSLISDPVHGYIHFTSLERAVLGHPSAQRLRYVSQTGLAHLVYPEARTSRFSHSLGAMHLVSRFFSSSLRHATPEVRERLCRAVKAAVEILDPLYGPADATRDFDGEPLLAHHYAPGSYHPFIMLAEQATRLAALFHDLGHLPFSHDFENALEEFWFDLGTDKRAESPLREFMEQRSEGAKLHERIGHAVALMLLRDMSAQGTSGTATNLVFRLALKIFTSPDNVESTISGTKGMDPDKAAFDWLHRLVDGEIDVDRCDYILRDGRNYGFKFSDYDLNRLLDNLTVCDSPTVKGRFIVAILPHGIPAAESFLDARFRSYQYAVRHHKVAQIGTALKHVIVSMLGSPDAEIDKFLRDIAAITSGEVADGNELSGLLRCFAAYDDVWWMGLMRGRTSTPWLELVCWRQPGPCTLWKWRGEFPGNLLSWNKRLPPTSDDILQRPWQEALTELKGKEILVVRHTFVPWQSDRKGESRLCVLMDGKPHPITTLSTSIRQLRNEWLEDVQVHAFALESCPSKIAEVYDRLESALVPPSS